MIDEKKLIEDIKSRKYIPNGLAEIFITIIDEQQLTDMWIPVSERLPENQPSYICGTDYYVTLNTGVVRSTKYKECKWIGSFGRLYSDNDIVAWQEKIIPQPYKEESK